MSRGRATWHLGSLLGMCRAVWMNVVFMIYMSISGAFQIPLWVSYSQFFLFKFWSASSWPHLLSLPQACVMSNNYWWLFLTIAPRKDQFHQKNSTRWNKGKPVSWVFQRISRVVKNISFLKSMLLGSSTSVLSSPVVARVAHFHCNCELLIFTVLELERRGKK